MQKSTPKAEILVVDDDQDYRVLIRHQLEALGYQVLESADGYSAFAILGQQYIPLIILDIVMPHIEGLEIIRRPRRKACPSKILAVSGAGKADEYLKIAGLLGADKTFEKTGPVSDLLEAVQGLIGRANAPREEMPAWSE